MRKHLVGWFAVALTALASIGAAPAADRSGVHGFDFEFGNWRVHHRIKRASGEPNWIMEFQRTDGNRAGA
jgi:hypothetical protein